MNPIIIIPARMASTRLPGKPLAHIAGKPMILHMLDRGREAGIGPVAVACGDPEIANAVREAGGRAVLTDPSLPSGSDRVHAALAELDPDRTHDVVVNLQGDFPTLDPEGLNGTTRLRLFVFGRATGEQARLVALLDNLGKGASGAAVQNLNLMLGLDEAEWLT